MSGGRQQSREQANVESLHWEEIRKKAGQGRQAYLNGGRAWNTEESQEFDAWPSSTRLVR